MSQWIFQADGNYVNFNGGGNLWRLHKDSNCISWHWDESGDLFFDVYDSEFTVKSENIADVIIDGSPLSTASDFPAAIRAVFTGLGGGASYLVYTALVTQTGTDAPVATVLENTLGGTVVLGRTGVGQYTATLTGAFTENKTVVQPFGNGPNGVLLLGIGFNTPFEYGYSIYRSNSNVVKIDVYKTTDYSFAELGEVATSNAQLLVEIRVYP